MSQINDIREAYAIVGKVAAVAREFNVDEKTVRKYIKQEDFSPRKPIPEERESRLDPYKEQIREWMDADNNIWYKQHHTAQRIHARLKEMYPEFDLSYPTVQRYVKEYKAQVQRNKTFQELVWHPGEAQVDFGECDFYERGVLTRKAPKAVEILDEGFDDVTAVFGLPAAYRKRLRTTNSIERQNEELRRRERVIRIFPNEESLIRLMGSVLMDIHEKWTTGKKYVTVQKSCEKSAPRRSRSQ